MSLIRDRVFSAAALAHLAVDLLNGQAPLLLAFLSAPLGLTNTLIGLISTGYTLAASLSQPLFGWLADRVGPRWPAAGGILWMAGMFALAVSTQGMLSLGLLILAALGSAAFHPAGALEASQRGREHFVGRETTATSLFFLFGQGGLSLGPALGGPLLDRFGPPGLLLLVFLVVPAGANAALRLPPGRRTAFGPRAAQGARRLARAALLAFILLVAMRSWAQYNLLTFIPKYYSDLGFRAGAYGLISALYMGASALGGVAGGWLADRYGKRAVAATTLALAALPIGLLPWLGPTAWTYLVTPLAGGLLGASHSIVVVMAQDMMPSRMGAASGLVLGFTFAAGSLGTLLSGGVADAFGFGPFFLLTAGVALTAAALSLVLREVQPVPEQAAGVL